LRPASQRGVAYIYVYARRRPWKAWWSTDQTDRCESTSWQDNLVRGSLKGTGASLPCLMVIPWRVIIYYRMTVVTRGKVSGRKSCGERWPIACATTTVSRIHSSLKVRASPLRKQVPHWSAHVTKVKETGARRIPTSESLGRK
jgi:hypothetical protein